MGGPLDNLAEWAIGVVRVFGYPGLFALMAMSSAAVPIPTEVVLPLAGFLAGQGRLSFAVVLVATTAGSTVGSLVLYGAGRLLGERRLRALVRRHGRFALVGESDLDKAHGWFERHGGRAVFIGRLVPGVGAYVSAPAGIERMPLPRFVLYSTLGGVVWNAVFVGLGWIFGDRWRQVQSYESVLEVSLLAIVLAGLLWLLWRRPRA